eukprot:TRINITY_DN32722_c0_g1_i1.p1 TRINITY_DN32722_c0_g1~~TRINITY_DN32722_c0_g1_i1.p1  ORF type:complete len:152 (+),score=17.12 TRINITY_DN32722_c0_g1_i1:132-587(+)
MSSGDDEREQDRQCGRGRQEVRQSAAVRFPSAESRKTSEENRTCCATGSERNCARFACVAAVPVGAGLGMLATKALAMKAISTFVTSHLEIQISTASLVHPLTSLMLMSSEEPTSERKQMKPVECVQRALPEELQRGAHKYSGSESLARFL